MLVIKRLKRRRNRVIIPLESIPEGENPLIPSSDNQFLEFCYSEFATMFAVDDATYVRVSPLVKGFLYVKWMLIYVYNELPSRADVNNVTLTGVGLHVSAVTFIMTVGRR
ncbi:hypothetical protein Tco_1094819 [Tanacetum coccineum]|uniref:Uncharacterized protein n=1 Tax=Tanacetum coccineum TaxID=301880 RepID=A0ABQ5IGK6_9ASTR